MKSTQACQVILVLFALAMFMMFTRSRENYSEEENMGYAVAKTFLGMYVDARRAVCAIAGDSENVDMAVEAIYERATKRRKDGDKCPDDFKTDKWKTEMNKAIDRFNKETATRTVAKFFGPPEIEIISTKDRKLLIAAAGIFAKNCKENGGKFTKDMIRENILGFKNAMCTAPSPPTTDARKTYYTKAGRFITAGQIKKLRENVKAGKLKNTPIPPRATERLSDEDAEFPQRGFRGPNGETMCKVMKYNKCIKWDPDNDKVGVEYAFASVIL